MTVMSDAAASSSQPSPNEIDSSWGDQCMVCPVKLNKHGRTVPNVGPLNLFTCFGVRIEAERAWLCSGCRRNFGRHKSSGGVKKYPMTKERKETRLRRVRRAERGYDDIPISPESSSTSSSPPSSPLRVSSSSPILSSSSSSAAAPSSVPSSSSKGSVTPPRVVSHNGSGTSSGTFFPQGMPMNGMMNGMGMVPVMMDTNGQLMQLPYLAAMQPFALPAPPSSSSGNTNAANVASYNNMLAMMPYLASNPFTMMMAHPQFAAAAAAAASASAMSQSSTAAAAFSMSPYAVMLPAMAAMANMRSMVAMNGMLASHMQHGGGGGGGGATSSSSSPLDLLASLSSARPVPSSNNVTSMDQSSDDSNHPWTPSSVASTSSSSSSMAASPPSSAAVSRSSSPHVSHDAINDGMNHKRSSSSSSSSSSSTQVMKPEVLKLELPTPSDPSSPALLSLPTPLST